MAATDSSEKSFSMSGRESTEASTNGLVASPPSKRMLSSADSVEDTATHRLSSSSGRWPGVRVARLAARSRSVANCRSNS